MQPKNEHNKALKKLFSMFVIYLKKFYFSIQENWMSQDYSFIVSFQKNILYENVCYL